MIALLDRFSRCLGMFCCWRNVRQCDIKEGKPPRTWRAFRATIAVNLELAAQRRRALAEANCHGSYDGVIDFTDTLRAQNADFVVMVRLPGSAGVIASASVNKTRAAAMTDALLDMADRIEAESVQQEAEPGEEWKNA